MYPRPLPLLLVQNMATEAPLGLAHVALAEERTPAAAASAVVVDEKGAFRFQEVKAEKELSSCEYFWCCHGCCRCCRTHERGPPVAPFREVSIENGVLKYDANIIDTEQTAMLIVSGRRSLRIPLAEIRAIRRDPFSTGDVLIWVRDSNSRIKCLANPDEFVAKVCAEIDKAAAAAAAVKTAPVDMQR